MTWHILNTLNLSMVPQAVECLEAVGRLDHLPPERDGVLAVIGDYDAYFASAEIRIDREFLDLAKRLGVIGSPSTGSDHMDKDDIRSRGIAVYDLSKESDLIANFTATSELAFGLLLCLVRRLVPAMTSAVQGDWARERYTGYQLSGKTFGVLGLGRLGRISSEIARGFGMRVVACDVAEVSADGVEIVSFDALLAESDVLSIHVHLDETTRGLIGRRELDRMKPGAILLNTSRGAIVDEPALLDGLKQGRLAGAGLDVVEGEWRDDLAVHPLIAYAREHDNLLITPHIGGATKESIHEARHFTARKLADHIRTRGCARQPN